MLNQCLGGTFLLYFTSMRIQTSELELSSDRRPILFIQRLCLWLYLHAYNSRLQDLLLLLRLCTRTSIHSIRELIG